MLEDTKTPNSPDLPGAGDHCDDVFHGALLEAAQPAQAGQLTAGKWHAVQRVEQHGQPRALPVGPEAVDTLLMGRVAAAALQRAQAGGRSGGPRPFGYEDDGITVRESEAEAVRVAVESVLAGASLRSVARELNKTGLTTAVKGRAWDAHAVRAVLLRSRNAGLRDHQGQVISPAPAEAPRP